ncbi:fumarylacetoacetate hydrolase family protein [Nereida sp. MMG025]|uniref:fumarylacetoacetate hydrolase family protein n=1 Tax=Nereida sp. MMG025 TaxID=2909981 RepID=UPI001F3235F3|nr:fumarylacetoacetate hydrolase family protein [Nereida sp. MMG025]MCF6445826.1 fumarylacetoacetate hydrolase family protein [Nereida sp. MMG025]
MTEYFLPPPHRPSVTIAGHTSRFAVRRIFCVGKNYADHVAEMGGTPQPPVFFTKPADAICEGGSIPYPSGTENLHFEAELVIALGRGGANISAANALTHVLGYATGNDLTRRDLQAQAKDKGAPWDMAKAFDRSAVIGPIHLVQDISHLCDAPLRCTVNGQLRQDGNINAMIWPVPEIIATLSQFVEVSSGDLIYTGTPAGVGAIGVGDRCEVSIEGLTPVAVTIE